MPRKSKQLALAFPTWGGKRTGAGRKRVKLGRTCVVHRARAVHRAAHPVHLTLRARAGLPPFRERAILAEMCGAIRAASRSPAVGDAFRVVEFSVQDDHVHFIVEASNADTLSRGVRGLAIRLARAVNRALGVSGPVWGDRYDARDLKTPREVRNAIVYVLMNARNHGQRLLAGVDRFSSAPWFAGFSGPCAHTNEERVVVSSRTWLGATGWRRHGLIRFDERPASGRRISR